MILSRNQIKEIVIKTISKQLGISENQIKESSNIVNDLGADSLDIAELIAALEESLNTEIPEKEINKLKTVKDIIDWLYSKRIDNKNASTFMAKLKVQRMKR